MPEGATMQAFGVKFEGPEVDLGGPEYARLSGHHPVRRRQGSRGVAAQPAAARTGAAPAARHDLRLSVEAVSPGAFSIATDRVGHEIGTHKQGRGLEGGLMARISARVDHLRESGLLGGETMDPLHFSTKDLAPRDQRAAWSGVVSARLRRASGRPRAAAVRCRVFGVAGRRCERDLGVGAGSPHGSHVFASAPQSDRPLGHHLLSGRRHVDLHEGGTVRCARRRALRVVPRTTFGQPPRGCGAHAALPAARLVLRHLCRPGHGDGVRAGRSGGAHARGIHGAAEAQPWRRDARRCRPAAGRDPGHGGALPGAVGRPGGQGRETDRRYADGKGASRGSQEPVLAVARTRQALP